MCATARGTILNLVGACRPDRKGCRMGFIDDAKENIAEGVDKAKDAVGGAAEFVKDKADDAGDFVADKTVDAADFFAEKAQAAADFVRDKLGDDEEPAAPAPGA